MLDIVISTRLKKRVDVAKGEYSVWNDVYAGEINADILIYGSSRAWVHFNPQMISDSFRVSCYNLGIDGHRFLLQHFRHGVYMNNNRPPHTIIYSIDISTLSKETELYNYEQFIPYMLFDAGIEKATRPYKGFNTLDFLLPLFRYSGKKDLIQSVLLKEDDKHGGRYKGYMARDLTWNGDLRTAKENMGNYTIVIDKQIQNKFEGFLKDCKNKGISVILVYSPEYVEGQLFVSNRSEVIKTFSNLAATYNLPWYDYSSHSISFQQKYFYNASHLNKAGSIQFTKALISDLKKDKLMLSNPTSFQTKL